MPNFHYIASTAKGESVRGSVMAMNRAEVLRKLGAQGLFLISCKAEEDASLAAVQAQPVPDVAAGTHPAPHARPTSWWASLFSGRTPADPTVKPKGAVSLKELVVTTRQISISINAGMSFVDALQGLSQNTKNPLMGYILRTVLDDILSGKKFSDALASHPEVFKVFYVSMAAAGEAGGFMPEALNRVAEFLEKEMELQSKIKSALIYPMLIAVVASVVVTGMMTFIVPTFVRVFQEMNAPLPAPTRALIVVSNFTRHGGFLTPVVLIGLFFALPKMRRRSEKFRGFYDEKILRLPVFGKIKTLEIITRFIRTLASLVDNGVMILMSLSVARQVVENRTIEKVVDDIYSSVQQGNGISPVLYKSPYFPVLVANMVATGEKTGSMPEVLIKMANYYDSEIAAAVRDMLTMLEPLLIIVMAVIVGFVIAGLMLPTFQMSSLVQS